MSQQSTLRDLDSTIMSAMKTAGFADVATYTAPSGGAALPCNVYVDRNAQFFGEQGDVAGSRITITLLLAEIPTQLRRASIVIGSETFNLDEIAERDESKIVWVVVNG